jgi:hypothetical protein
MNNGRGILRDDWNYIAPEADSASLATKVDKTTEPILVPGLTLRLKLSQARLHPARRPDRRLPQTLRRERTLSGQDTD